MTELFDVVDENDNVIGRAARQECHSDPKKIHRSIFIFIYSDKGELLVQKRSMKMDTSPGTWAVSVGGHNNVGESYESAAKREMKEELGIQAKLRLISKKLFEYPQEREFSAVFAAKHNGPFSFDKNEIDKVKFVSPEWLAVDIKNNPTNYSKGIKALLNKFPELFNSDAFIP